MLKFLSQDLLLLCSSVKKVIKSGRVRHMSSLFGITVLDTKHTCVCVCIKDGDEKEEDKTDLVLYSFGLAHIQGVPPSASLSTYTQLPVLIILMMIS